MTLIKAADAAKMLGLTGAAVYAMAARRELPCVEIRGARKRALIRFELEALEAFIRGHRTIKVR